MGLGYSRRFSRKYFSVVWVKGHHSFLGHAHVKSSFVETRLRNKCHKPVFITSYFRLCVPEFPFGKESVDHCWSKLYVGRPQDFSRFIFKGGLGSL